MGKKMSLVAAGWYCAKDDLLIDPATGKPIERFRSIFGIFPEEKKR